MDRLTAEQVGELERLEAKAMRGPWMAKREMHGWHIGPQPDGACSAHDWDLNNACTATRNSDGSNREQQQATVDLIAALRNHAPSLLATAKREAEQAAEIERLRGALIACHTDIGHWLQLARYQREKMDQNLGWCPTEDGITRSEMVRGQISTALGKEERT